MVVAAGALAAVSCGSVAQQQWKDPGFNQVVWVDTPNQNKRPPGTVVDTIVLHHTAGVSLWSTVSWFATDKSQVSAHFCVGRDGSIVQFLSTYDRAWHAGVSLDAFGRKGVNDFSVGIEIVNKGDGTEEYPAAQLRALDNLFAVLLRRFPTVKQITSHEFIAEPQGRKNDPIKFPWERLKHFGVSLYFGLKR